MYLGFKPGYASEGTVKFFLFNDRQGIAIVSAINVVVHVVTRRPPERPRAPGAPLKEYEYFVELAPVVGTTAVTDDQFKYGPGDIDMFSIEIGSNEQGYDYVISIEVTWYDVQSGAAQILTTPREIVAFPLYEG